MAVVTNLVLAVVGLALLARAADVFVDGAVGLSNRFEVPPVLVGAVVIGLGTSVPELLVSVLAALDGDVELGVGNVVGSNIANLSLVLGVAALIAPVAVRSTTLRREAPLSVAAVAAFGAVVALGLPRAGGIILLLALVAALVVSVRTKAAPDDIELVEEVEELEATEAGRSTARLGLRVFVGLIGTVVGAELVVRGATRIAEESGLAQGLLGLTLVALGTSLPELVTAVHATRRGEDELVLGNVLGSNVFNSLLAGGMLAVISPGPIDDTKLATRGVAVMVMVVVFGWASMARGRRISRPRAAVLLTGYLVAVVVTI